MDTIKTKTFQRYVVIKDCKEDFGLGPGVVATDVITYSDPRDWGFDHPLLRMNMLEDAEVFIKEYVTVMVDELEEGEISREEYERKLDEEFEEDEEEVIE